MSEETSTNLDQLLNQAKTCHHKGDFAAASKHYQVILNRNENHFEALYLLGTLFAQIKNYGPAQKYFKRAYDIKNEHPSLLVNYSHLLQCLDRNQEALSVSNQLLNLDKSNAGGWHNRSIILEKLNDISGALSSSKNAITLNAENMEYQARYGLLLYFSGKKREALQHLNHFRTLYPDHITILSCLSKIYSDEGYYHHDRKILEQILKHDSNHAFSRFNLSYIMFLRGDFQSAWPLYEARWQSVAISSDYNLIQIQKQIGAPILSKTDMSKDNLHGKTILICSEQGLGDVIQFTRFLPLLKTLGAIVKFLPRNSHKAIIPLVENHESFDECVDISKPFSRPDYQMGIMSFGFLFDIEEETIPPPLDIHLTKEKIHKWQRLTAHLPNKTRIGFFLRGSGKIKGRDLSMKEFSSLFSLSDIDFICLQIDINEDELAIINQYDNVHRFDDDIDDLADTTALLRHCDKVIAIDSSIAHLAGMTGRQRQGDKTDSITPKSAFLWLLLDHLPTFRWMLRRKDSPWYKNTYLWRSHKRGHWQRLIQKLKTELSELI